MKKLLAITLTVAMLFTMTAMAENIVDETNGNTHNVFAKYAGNEGGATIYSVDIAWGSLEYTYNDANAGTWDPTTHTYKGVSEAGWTCVEGADTISVTNHSNAGISVMVNYENESGIENVEGIIENENFNLPSAENKSVEDSELTDTAKLIMSGELDSNYETMTKIGTVTITINGDDSSNSSENSPIEDDFNVTSLNARSNSITSNTINVDSSNHLFIYVHGSNFDDSIANTILNRLSLYYNQKFNSLDIDSEYLSVNIISTEKIEIELQKDYFTDEDYNMYNEINISEIVYTSDHNNVEYTGMSISVLKD